MSPDGAAREVAPGRLANFEDDDLPDLTTLRLPPRSRARDKPPPAATTASSPAAATTRPPRTAARRAPANPQPPTPAAPAAVAADPTAEPAGKGPEDRVRSSNVHVPTGLLKPLEHRRATLGLSTGEIIIQALEATYDRLDKLVDPVPVSGGHLFAARRSHSSRAAEGPLSSLNYRMRMADFDTLDRLVEQTGAASRSRLISVALTAYLDPSH